VTSSLPVLARPASPGLSPWASPELWRRRLLQVWRRLWAPGRGIARPWQPCADPTLFITRAVMNSVEMTEIAARIDVVADEPFQGFHIGKTAIALALPDQFAAEKDLENAAGAGDQRHAAQFHAKSREQLLGHPAGPQQPV